MASPRQGAACRAPETHIHRHRSPDTSDCCPPLLPNHAQALLREQAAHQDVQPPCPSPITYAARLQLPSPVFAGLYLLKKGVTWLAGKAGSVWGGGGGGGSWMASDTAVRLVTGRHTAAVVLKQGGMAGSGHGCASMLFGAQERGRAPGRLTAHLSYERLNTGAAPTSGTKGSDTYACHKVHWLQFHCSLSHTALPPVQHGPLNCKKVALPS